ncbi:hypothetical protein [Polaromonas sp. YR568]|uniref:hypothetical protein n=1 Tax=Polaromonas sp. YR568 TaxID=1855301 RepID=UPI003137F888
MKTASIPPTNLLLLAALGIGAYWFATRSAQGAGLSSLVGGIPRPAATPLGPVAQTYQRNDSALWNAVGKIGGAAFDKLFNSTTPTVYQQQNASYSGTGSVYDGSVTGDPYSGYNDGYAANLAPGYGSIYDYSQEYWY